MVVQKAVDKLKEGTHEEKHAAASAIAVGVVMVLFVGWAYFFIRNLKNNPPTQLDTSAIPSDLFDTSTLQNTAGEDTYLQQLNQLEELRNNAAQEEAGVRYQAPQEGASSPNFEGSADFEAGAPSGSF